jgi:hypothetical protein
LEVRRDCNPSRRTNFTACLSRQRPRWTGAAVTAESSSQARRHAGSPSDVKVARRGLPDWPATRRGLWNYTVCPGGCLACWGGGRLALSQPRVLGGNILPSAAGCPGRAKVALTKHLRQCALRPIISYDDS